MRALIRMLIPAIGIVMAVTSPAHAAETSADQLQAEITGFLGNLGRQSHGVVTWDGSDPYQVHEEGGAAVAVISHARLTIHGPDLAQIAFDRVEFRLAPVKDDPKFATLSILFPEHSTLTTATGIQTTLTLVKASANVVIEAASGRARDTEISMGGGHVDEAKSGLSLGFGPLTMSSKLTIAGNGAWTAPVAFEAKTITFSTAKSPFSGSINRIAYNATSAGPRFAAFETLRARIEQLQTDDKRPSARSAAFLSLLPALPEVFSELGGKLELDGLSVRSAANQPALSLTKATMGGTLTGFSGDIAAFRLTLQQQGLDVSPSLFPAEKVPHRITIDCGIENLDTAALHGVLEAAAQMTPAASPEQKQNATVALMVAAAKLAPTFRIYDISFDTKKVGIDMTGVAKGSPLLPTGYSASGDVLVRGFDAIPSIAAGAPYLDYLPLLRELATDGATADGAKAAKFHLASTPQKPITINGNDVSAWFSAPAGKPRLLRPSEPPMHGADVAAVQAALASAHIAVATDGVYSPATAAAVARFQKEHALNVSGVVDAATRDKLGVKEAEEAPGAEAPRAWGPPDTGARPWGAPSRN